MGNAAGGVGGGLDGRSQSRISAAPTPTPARLQPCGSPGAQDAQSGVSVSVAGEGVLRGDKGSRRRGKLLLRRGLSRLGLARDSALGPRHLAQRRGSSEESGGDASLSIGQPYRLAASHEQLRVLLVSLNGEAGGFKSLKQHSASHNSGSARWEEFKTKQCPAGPAPCPPEHPPPLPRKLSRSRSSAGRASRCARMARADSLPAMQLSSC